MTFAHLNPDKHPVGSRLLVQHKQPGKTPWSDPYELTVGEYAPSGNFVRGGGDLRHGWASVWKVRVVEVLKPLPPPPPSFSVYTAADPEHKA